MNSALVSVKQVEHWECRASDGTEYIRFGRLNWCVWMGESLEIVQDDRERGLLEMEYQRMLRAETNAPSVERQ